MSLGRSETKELHILDRSLGDRDAARRQYAKEFQDSGAGVGEFTPSYLRSLWAPSMAAELLDPEVVVVILRDPIERFHSSLRLIDSIANSRRRKLATDFRHHMAMDAQWAGMYADQLDAWARAIAPERIAVLQFEQVTTDPSAALEGVWKRLGLDPVPVDLGSAHRNEALTANPDDSLRSVNAELTELYKPQLERLEQWGVDLSLWKTTAGTG